jgi:hypothetical protein
MRGAHDVLGVALIHRHHQLDARATFVIEVHRESGHQGWKLWMSSSWQGKARPVLMGERTRRMRRQPRLDQGFTVYQLLVSIVVVVILGSLWMAYTNHQKLQQQQRSAVALLLHG